MLGEKEEEVEAVLADLKEVKDMYRAQMDDLLGQLTAHAGQRGSATRQPQD